MSSTNLMRGSWRHLTFFNYEVENSLLEPHLPVGAEIDLFNGKVYLSLVGLMFENLKILEVDNPLHTSFEQVNLRFYVRYPGDHGWDHGVVFLDEIVPEPLMAAGARLLAGEPYRATKMRHHVEMPLEDPAANGTIEYSWQNGDEWCHMRAVTTGAPRQMNAGSKEEFLAHRLWGYSGRNEAPPQAYHVEHPRWRYWPVGMANLECDVASTFGRQYVGYIKPVPDLAFVAEGSEVEMLVGR